MIPTRKSRLLASLCIGGAVLMLAVSGCAAADGQGDTDQGSRDMGQMRDGLIDNQGDTGAPVDGGAATYASFAEPNSLDPAKTISAATTGGVEMLNIYDSLMRYDAEQKTDVPHMAQNLTHDDDFTTWTLTLREGVAFSDGTALDSAAVQASQQRFAAADGPDAAVWNDNVVDIATPDSMTVVYTLDRTWPQFSNTLTTGAGMIVAPSAGAPGAGFTPIGAGPFTFESWAQGTSITLAANKDYWAGAPYLANVKILYIPKTEVARETFLNGGTDVVYLREPDDIEGVLSAGFPGYVGMSGVASVSIINASPGRAGADPRVRKAMQLAADPTALAQRGYGTDVFASSELFADYSRWHTDVGGPEVDLDRARQLLDEAKSEGYDGTILMDISSGDSSHQQAMALQAQLEAVGFTVDLRRQPTSADHIRAVAAEGDYDIAEWGISLREPDPYVKMVAAMRSGGKQVYGMYTSPEMDALVNQFQSATNDEDKLSAVADIQRQVNDDVPFIAHGYFPEYLAWQKNLHGMQGSSGSMISFAKAWKS